MVENNCGAPNFDLHAFVPKIDDVVLSRCKQLYKLIGVSSKKKHTFYSHLLSLDLHRLPYLGHVIFKGDSKGACSLLLNHYAFSGLLNSAITTCTLVQSNMGAHSGDGRAIIVFDDMAPDEHETLYLTVEAPLDKPGLTELTTSCWIKRSDQGNRIQERLVLSPTLPKSGIAVSNNSAIAAIFLTKNDRFSLLKDTEFSEFIKKMCIAETLIQSVWPEFFTLIKQFISVIIPAEVKSETRKRIIRYGASRKDFPGAIFMNDYHRQEISIAELCENLIHETVHNLLFLMEEVEAWFNHSTIEQLIHSEMQSPWSSRKLPVYSFFHSIIVFRVVAQWSDLCQKENIFHEDKLSVDYISQRYAQLTKGFSNAKKILRNEPVDKYLNINGRSMLHTALAG